MDTFENAVHNADISKNTTILFLNRMKCIEGSLIKSSGKISREH